MLPTRAYAPASVLVEARSSDRRPTLVIAVAPEDFELYPASQFSRIVVRNTPEAIRSIERERARVVAVDWDDQERFDGTRICEAAQERRGTGILATMTAPESAPSALKAGCHAILLRPLTINLIAARLGRLLRELPTDPVMAHVASRLGQFGTNCTCPEIGCPKCQHVGAVSFEHSSHRRDWYACLSCEAVWLARRQE
jgi:DNA-binding response OmpR family regulator